MGRASREIFEKLLSNIMLFLLTLIFIFTSFSISMYHLFIFVMTASIFDSHSYYYLMYRFWNLLLIPIILEIFSSGAFSQWRRYDSSRQEQMKAELERIKSTEGLSKDTFEVALRCLKWKECSIPQKMYRLLRKT